MTHLVRVSLDKQHVQTSQFREIKKNTSDDRAINVFQRVMFDSNARIGIIDTNQNNRCLFEIESVRERAGRSTP